MTAGEELDAFRNTIEDLLRNGCKDIVLEFFGVETVDSAGLGEIVRAYTMVKRHGGTLRCRPLSKAYAGSALDHTADRRLRFASSGHSWSSALWLTLGVLLVLALLLVLRFSGLAGLT